METYVNTLMPQNLAVQLRVEAARRNVSRSELVRRAVMEYLQNLQPEPIAQRGESKNGNK